MSSRNPFAEAGYQAHNRARQSHLASLGLELSCRSVLELGAGVGDHTQFFLDRGCEVTITDGRKENVEALRARFPGHNVNLCDIVHQNFPCDWPADAVPEEHRVVSWKWGVVYAYGLLYHIEDPAYALERMADCTRDMLLLETCVAPDDAPEPLTFVDDEASDPRASLRGKGCRPTRVWILKQLLGCFPHVYFPRTQPDHLDFPTDWTVPLGPGNHRAVFVASRRSLAENQRLTSEMPQRQLPWRPDA